MSSTWIFDSENVIYTVVKKRVSTALLTAYPSLRFTSDDDNATDTQFPTVYIHWLPGYEMARELKNTEINAAQCDVQIEVYTNREQGQKSAKEVMAEVIQNFVILGFEIYQMPEFLSTGNDTKRMVARARRTLASGDTLYTNNNGGS